MACLLPPAGVLRPRANTRTTLQGCLPLLNKLGTGETHLFQNYARSYLILGTDGKEMTTADLVRLRDDQQMPGHMQEVTVMHHGTTKQIYDLHRVQWYSNHVFLFRRRMSG